MEKRDKKESCEKICYSLLCEVFITGRYSTIMLGQALAEIPAPDRPAITRLFYGVLEKNIQFDYIIKQLTERPPHKSVAILIKIGLYLLRYTDVPPYAAIDKTVALSKQVGKSGVSGFINAVLRKSQTVVVPDDNLSAQLSYPDWVIRRLLKRYAKDEVVQMLKREDGGLRHIRHNPFVISEKDFAAKIHGAKKTALGYFAAAPQIAKLKPNEYTFQSLSSMLAVKSYLSGQCFLSVLDVCSAPGGKAIYLKQLCPNSSVLCSDIHPHRVELVKKYAQRMGADVACACGDATEVNAEWLCKFDLVICDVPCSGFGVKSKPDILLNRKESDLTALAKIQYDILSASANYVKVGGILCYSTCTLFVEENEDVVNKFLAANNSFQLSPIVDDNIPANCGMVNLSPATHNSDGFFIARLVRKS